MLSNLTTDEMILDYHDCRRDILLCTLVNEVCNKERIRVNKEIMVMIREELDIRGESDRLGDDGS